MTHLSQQLTIILPTRNEVANIGTFLASIPADIPLVVVDSSEDHTRHLITNLRPQCTHIIHTMANIPQARQLGAEEADTPYLLFTDADIVFAPDYFERVGVHLHHDLVYGSKRSHGEYRHYYQWFMRAQQLLDILGCPAVSGSNLLVRRSTLYAVGGFDVALPVNEDTELGFRVKRQGYDIRFAPTLRVIEHDHRRLERDGVLGKTTHTIMRNILLYFNLMPSRWRRHDWGYWSQDKG